MATKTIRITGKTSKTVFYKLSLKRFRRRVKSNRKRKLRRRRFHAKYISNIRKVGGELTYENIISRFLPVNVRYIMESEKSPFNIEVLAKVPKNVDSNFMVPEQFSIIDNARESYQFIQRVTAALIFQRHIVVNIDYAVCQRADVGAQVLLDIILRDLIAFFKIARQIAPKAIYIQQINGTNFKSEAIKKLLFSIGSPAIHMDKTIKFKDIIPYKLCIHDRDKSTDPVKIIEKKDIDTTTLVDYVLSCLERVHITLSPERIDDLCIVISEILINAEEHATTKYRFSIGYFHEIEENGRHYGVFRLAILNFGKTIYEKFKDPDCPNTTIVEKMRALSNTYTKKKFFLFKEFEEETLWTLYALQEGVTTVAPDEYIKRGHGSIQFIESFFNIRNENQEKDDVSRLAILSGNAKIVFDGNYKIQEKIRDGERFKYMTFNESGNIEDKPDAECVKFVHEYFPGTIISAKILFNDSEFKCKIE